MLRSLSRSFLVAFLACAPVVSLSPSAVNANSSGAPCCCIPPSACMGNSIGNDMVVSSSSPTFTPGQTLEITFSNPNEDFIGFLFYAFVGDEPGTYVGSFTNLPALAKLGMCDPEGTSVTHINSTVKNDIIFDWIAPDTEEPVTFAGLAIKSRFEYWLVTPLTVMPVPSDVDAPLASLKAATITAAPNPFVDDTSIRFALDEGADVRVRVLDVLGKTLRTVEQGWKAAGSHSISWDGRDDRGDKVPAGAYFVRLDTGSVPAFGKILRIGNGGN